MLVYNKSLESIFFLLIKMFLFEGDVCFFDVLIFVNYVV